MFGKTTIKCLAAGVLLLAVAGCACAPTTAKPAPVATAGGPALLHDGLASAPTPKPVSTENRKLAFSQVQGDLVYNLGQGVVANSASVILAGGFAAPKAARLPGGVAGCCPNPLPQVYLDAIRDNRALTTRSATPNVAVATTVQPVQSVQQSVDGDTWAWEPGVLAAAGYCETGTCPTYPESRTVCQPGDNLSDCFTLPENEAAAARLYVPQANVPLNVEESAGVLARVETAGRADALAPPVSVVAAPVTEVAVVVVETVKPVEPAAPVAPKVDTAAPVARGNVADIMPPVPDVADFDAAIDAILSRDGDVSSAQSLPEVQLPPQLR